MVGFFPNKHPQKMGVVTEAHELKAIRVRLARHPRSQFRVNVGGLDPLVESELSEKDMFWSVRPRSKLKNEQAAHCSGTYRSWQI